MAEYTNRVEIEELPEGINVDGIGDILPEGGDDLYQDWNIDTNWNEEEEEDWSAWTDKDAAESDPPHDRFSEFAGVSAALFDSICSALSDKKVRELEFSTTSGDIGAYFSIKTRDR